MKFNTEEIIVTVAKATGHVVESLSSFGKDASMYIEEGFVVGQYEALVKDIAKDDIRNQIKSHTNDVKNLVAMLKEARKASK